MPQSSKPGFQPSIGLILICVLIGVAGIANSLASPEHAIKFLAAAVIVPTVIVILIFATHSGEGERHTESETNHLERSFMGGGFILLAALIAALAQELGWIGDNFSDRFIGILSGVVVIVIGDATPKIIPSSVNRRMSANTMRHVHRFMGRAFVGAGVATVFAWGLAPPDLARVWFVAPIAAAMTASTLRIVIALMRERRA